MIEIAQPHPYVVIGGLGAEVRRQLVLALTSAGGIVVAEASSLAEVVGLITRWEADAAVLDLQLGPSDVLTALHEIKAQLSSARVVVIADDMQYRARLLGAGAEAVILKDNTSSMPCLDLEEAEAEGKIA